jgi:hypothetical protein
MPESVEAVRLSSRVNKVVLPIYKSVIVSQCGHYCYPTPVIQIQPLSRYSQLKLKVTSSSSTATEKVWTDC